MFGLRTRRAAAEAGLLADLDRLAAEGNAHARAFARRVRDGQIERCLGEVAEHAALASTVARLTPVMAAFVRHERATTGVNLAPRGRDLERAREVAAVPQRTAAEAERRTAAVLARAVDNQRARTLHALRSEGSR